MAKRTALIEMNKQQMDQYQQFKREMKTINANQEIKLNADAGEKERLAKEAQKAK